MAVPKKLVSQNDVGRKDRLDVQGESRDISIHKLTAKDEGMKMHREGQRQGKEWSKQQFPCYF